MIELPNATSKFLHVMQVGTYWCIPAAIETALRYLGSDNATQEQLVLSFCRSAEHDDPGPLVGFGEDLYRLNNLDVLRAARSHSFRATFDHFVSALERDSPDALKSKGVEFRTEGDPGKVESTLVDTLKDALPFFISVPTEYFGAPGAEHTMGVFKYSGDQREGSFYDPWHPALVDLSIRTIVDDCTNNGRPLNCLFLART